jgi:hypothetical protein
MVSRESLLDQIMGVRFFKDIYHKETPDDFCSILAYQHHLAARHEGRQTSHNSKRYTKAKLAYDHPTVWLMQKVWPEWSWPLSILVSPHHARGSAWMEAGVIS